MDFVRFPGRLAQVRIDFGVRHRLLQAAVCTLLAALQPACGKRGGGSGGGTPSPDTTPPAAVTDLAAFASTSTTVTLSWTAPGDDGTSGTASSYNLRYAAMPISDLSAWAGATPVAGIPAPSAGGTPQIFTVTGLTPHTTYYFSLRASDEVPNVGGLSNSPTRPTTLIPPGGLAALTVSPTQIDLHWLDNAPDESGYRVERSLDGVSYSSLTTLPAGSEYYPDPNLSPSTLYYYRVSSMHPTGLPGTAVDSATTLPAIGGWRTSGRDLHHSAYPVDSTGVPPLNLAWSVTPGASGSYLHPAVVENGRVFITAYSYFAASTGLWARNLSDGSPIWSFDFGNVPHVSDPAVFQGRVFVPVINTSNSYLSARDAATGNPLWTAPFPSQFQDLWAPTCVGHRVYMNAGTFGGLYAWDAAAGAPLFSNTTLAMVDQWSPLYLDGKIYSYDGAVFRAHHPSTGANLWSVPIAANTAYSMNSSAVSSQGRIFILAKPDLAAIDPVAQSILWSVSGYEYAAGLACADGVLFALNDGTLHARDAGTGALLWTFLGDRRLSYPPVVANNHVYVASDSNIYAVNLGTRSEVWTAAVGGWITISDGVLLLAQPNGALSAYAFAGGARPAETVVPAAPTGLSAVAGLHSRIDLTWTAPPSGVIGYQVEHSPDNSTWSLLTTLGYGTTSAAELGLAPTVTTYYRVRAYNSAGASGPSNVASASVAAPTALWSTFGGTPVHSGDVPGEILAPPANYFWSASVATVPIYPVAMEDLRVFVTAPYPNQQLVALDEGGTVAWSHDFGANINLGPPAVDRGRVYVPSTMMTGGDFDPKLFCFDAKTGQALWTGIYRAQTGSTYAPTVVGGTVFLNEAFNYGIAAFNVGDGRRIFENVAIAPVVDDWTPAWQAGTLYTLSAGNFRAHDPATGVVQWTTTVPNVSTSNSIGSVPVLTPTYAYFTSVPDLRAVNLTTHANDWTVSGGGVPTPAYFGTPAVSGSQVYVYKGQVVLGGTLEVRDANGLGLLWSFAGDGALKYPPVVANGHVFVSSDANTYAVNLSTHAQVWTTTSGGWLALSNGRLYIAKPNGGVAVLLLQ